MGGPGALGNDATDDYCCRANCQPASAGEAGLSFVQRRSPTFIRPPPTPEVRSIIIDREAGTVEVADYGWGKITNQDAAGILYFAEKENYDFRGYVNSVTGKAEVAVGGMVFQGTCQPTKPLF